MGFFKKALKAVGNVAHDVVAVGVKSVQAPLATFNGGKDVIKMDTKTKLGTAFETKVHAPLHNIGHKAGQTFVKAWTGGAVDMSKPVASGKSVDYEKAAQVAGDKAMESEKFQDSKAGNLVTQYKPVVDQYNKDNSLQNQGYGNTGIAGGYNYQTTQQNKQQSNNMFTQLKPSGDIGLPQDVLTPEKSSTLPEPNSNKNSGSGSSSNSTTTTNGSETLWQKIKRWSIEQPVLFWCIASGGGLLILILLYFAYKKFFGKSSKRW